MNKSRSYEAFTLVEMLIVMGIIIILMGVGITAGRFAINRANDVAHQNAVDQIYQALQAYYTDNREFPGADDAVTIQAMLGTDGALVEYLDSGAFDGGTDATYGYWVQSGQGQEVMVCVSLGGENDEKERGIYCNGNSFGGEFATGGVNDKTNEFASTSYNAINSETMQLSSWTATDTWGTETGTIGQASS